jgi:hypothetical protein
MGLQPGPQYKKILDNLLDARIDGVITTETEERTFVQKRLWPASRGKNMLAH